MKSMYLSYILGLKRKGVERGKNAFFNICTTFWNMFVVLTCSVGDYTSWCWCKVTPGGPVGPGPPSPSLQVCCGSTASWSGCSLNEELGNRGPNRGRESVRQFPSAILEALLLRQSSGSRSVVGWNSHSYLIWTWVFLCSS